LLFSYWFFFFFILKFRLLAILLILLLFILHGRIYSQFLPSCARAQGMGITGAVLADGSSGWTSQASLAALKKPAFALQYENQYTLPELGRGSLLLSLPAVKGTFGIFCSFFGTNAYHEQHAGMLFGHALGNILRAGIGIHYVSLGQSVDNSRFHTLVPSLDIQLTPTGSVIAALRVFNPLGQQYHPACSKHLPTQVIAGIGFNPQEDLLVCVEFFEQISEKPFLSFGAEYMPCRRISLRGGISGGEKSWSFGMGLLIPPIKADISVRHHRVLGFSPAVTLSYSL
jgi:hypothetical protein